MDSTKHHVRIQRGTGGPDPLKNHKDTGFLSNTGRDPLKNQKAIKPDSKKGRHRHASETPLKWRFARGQMRARL